MAGTIQASVISNQDGIITVSTSIVEPASNSLLVQDAVSAFTALHLEGGRGIKLTGPISIPMAFAIAHAVAHRYGYVACFDPKLQRYVVVISHDPAAAIGDLIE